MRDHDKLAVLFLAVGLALAAYFFYGLEPLSAGAREARKFEVKRGEGFREIADRLNDEKIIRSALAFKLYSLITGRATRFKPGIYRLGEALGAPEIAEALVLGANREVEVVIPEGSSAYDVDELLAKAEVLPKGSIIRYEREVGSVEGRLFPDTYKFFTGSDGTEVIARLLNNFKEKAQPILSQDPKNAEANLTLASLIEKEAPDFEDRRLIAGILKKRLSSGRPLQVDATICYIKRASEPEEPFNCYPITALDLKAISPYNSYLNVGLPKGPIASPGLSAIKAALNPKSSTYWFYLSDPATHRIIFSRTLSEHAINRSKYLTSS